MDERWTIDELESQAHQALSVDYEGPANGQVRAMPDARTIRYYTSLGLVDRPVAMRGRTALYDRRHLEQVVAIKRLQAAGRSLAEVQAELAGASRKRIAEIAALPPRFASERGHDVQPRRQARAAFWKALPEPPAPVDQAEPSGPSALAGQAAPSSPAGQRDRIAALVMIARLELAPGIELSFRPHRTLDAVDVARLRAAAAPLIAELTSTGAIDPNPARPTRTKKSRQ